MALGTCAASAEPTKLWEASGFQNPESALPDVAGGILYVSNVAGGPGDKDGNGFISKVSLADGWQHTEAVDKGARWEPDELGPVVETLLAKAPPPAPVYGA